MVNICGFRFLYNILIPHVGVVLHLIGNIGTSSDQSFVMKHVIGDVSLTHLKNILL